MIREVTAVELGALIHVGYEQIIRSEKPPAASAFHRPDLDPPVDPQSYSAFSLPHADQTAELILRRFIVPDAILPIVIPRSPGQSTRFGRSSNLLFPVDQLSLFRKFADYHHGVATATECFEGVAATGSRTSSVVKSRQGWYRADFPSFFPSQMYM